MDKEYILSFSSFYKAAYARDVLEQKKINSNLRKLPPEVVSSCSTGLYLRNVSIGQVRKVLDENQIVTKGIFLIVRSPSGKSYVRV